MISVLLSSQVKAIISSSKEIPAADRRNPPTSPATLTHLQEINRINVLIAYANLHKIKYVRLSGITNYLAEYSPYW